MDLQFAEIRNISQLCMQKDGNKSVPLKVEIPYYQRPYKWDSKRIEDLIADFHKNEEMDDENEGYFAGSVVMVAGKDGKFKIVDGQQRITTLFLMNYLRFILIRGYIDELIHERKIFQIADEMNELIDTAINIFAENKVSHLREIKTEISNYANKIAGKNTREQFDEAEELWNQLTCYYQDSLCLVTRDVSGQENYKKVSVLQNKKFLLNTELALTYSRNSYNEKLKEALSRMVMDFTNLTNPQLDSLQFDKNSGKRNTVTEQYMNAITVIYKNLYDTYIIDKKIDFEEYVKKLSDAIKKILENIKFCVVVTGKDKDAYTLFEVLNDRNFPVEDLELIKNLFYKWYCDHNDDDDNADEFIERADRKWVEEIFPDTKGKERSKLISYLAAQYFTADSSLKYNDNEKYREAIEKKYLIDKEKYDGESLLNDICVYEMIGIILDEFDFRYKNKAEIVIRTERQNSKSITYKALNLFNALGLYGIIPAVTNIIIKIYLDKSSVDANNYDEFIENFREYVRKIKEDGNNIQYERIHNVAYDFWRFALLTKDSEEPRNMAKDYIAKNNVKETDYVLGVESQYMDGLKEGFEKWIGAWRYGNGEDKLKLRVKVLFINLFNTNKIGNVLIFNKTGTTFKKDNIQLDHLEPDNVNASAKERYFEPSSNVARENYTEELGNFMIMDGESNNNKSDMPLQKAIGSSGPYKEMSDNWLIQEIHEIFDDADCGIDRHVENVDGESIEVYRVPNEEFFNRRKQRLIAYFKAILSKGLNDDKVEITKR